MNTQKVCTHYRGFPPWWTPCSWRGLLQTRIGQTPGRRHVSISYPKHSRYMPPQLPYGCGLLQFRLFSTMILY